MCRLVLRSMLDLTLKKMFPKVNSFMNKSIFHKDYKDVSKTIVTSKMEFLVTFINENQEKIPSYVEKKQKFFFSKKNQPNHFPLEKPRILQEKFSQSRKLQKIGKICMPVLKVQNNTYHCVECTVIYLFKQK